MQPGACGTGYRLIFGLRRIRVVIVEAVLNVQFGIRTSEDKWGHPVSLQFDRAIWLCLA
jgi:hypothetical protein